MRTLFLSDLHLGANGCQADKLLDFLKDHTSDALYLVGDVFDVWRPLGANWRESHHAVLRELFARARSGVKIYFTPGNHDAFFRAYFGDYCGAITVAHEVIHNAADGQRYLVTHGDAVDLFECRAPYLSKLGAHIESLLRGMQHGINRLQRQRARQDWAGVDRILGFANRALRMRNSHEKRLVALARAQGVDGIVCGHFHQAALHAEHGLTYANCGDWTGSSTALAEDASGRFSILRWSPEAAPFAARFGMEAESWS